MKKLATLILLLFACTSKGEALQQAELFKAQLGLERVQCTTNPVGCADHEALCVGIFPDGEAISFRCYRECAIITRTWPAEQK